jgi:DNA repair exonuclease SbcCD nuclease subunit
MKQNRTGTTALSATNLIHTADLHLKEPANAGLEVLSFALQLARDSCACLIIAGDLFDTEHDANALRSAVRQVFDRFPDVPVFLIPGNHDENCYLPSHNWGASVNILSRQPFSIVDYKDTQIVAVPFVTGLNLRAALENYKPPEPPSIAVAHGTFFGKDHYPFYKDVKRTEDKYFPIYESDIRDLKCAYIALGHFHSGFIPFDLGAQKVCYPGSPVCLSEGELGPRYLARISLNSVSHSASCEPVEVPVGEYNIVRTFLLFAGQEDRALSELTAFTAAARNPRVRIIANLQGYTQIPESELTEKINSLKRKFEKDFASLSIRDKTTSYHNLITEHPLVRAFVKDLRRQENITDNIRARALELALKAFDKAKRRKK